MIYALLIIVCLIGAVYGGGALVGFFRERVDKNRLARVASDKALNKAEKALRSIANGAGSPVLEAQIALDEISTTYHQKELN